MDYSSASISVEALAPTAEIPIIYFSTHGVYDVETDDNQMETDSNTLDLAIEIPNDMTIIKFNFVPINVCNYGGGGTIGPRNIPDHIHSLISKQLNPKIIMARYGFEYFLVGDLIANEEIRISGLKDSLEKYRRHKFIDVPLEDFYNLLCHIARSHGLREETVLDKIMSELNDCKINDTVISDSKLTVQEKESVIRGNNVMNHNTMMMKIIEECVKNAVKDIKAELNQGLEKMNNEMKELKKIYLNPKLTGIPIDFRSQQQPNNIFNSREDVKVLTQNINDIKAYFNHVDDFAKSSNWSISIPKISGKSRYILNKRYSLQPENEPEGLEWNITMFKPKTGAIVDILGLRRKMILKSILENLYRERVKTAVFVDQTCSLFREITPEGARLNVQGRLERKWANIVKKLNEGDTIYRGKRKKQKRKKQKTQKNKNKKHKKEKM